MTRYTLIYIIILFINHSLLCMNKSCMTDISTKKKSLPSKKTPFNNNYSIIKELLFAHTMRKKNIFPRDITNYILHYSSSLKDKIFAQNNETYALSWKDFNIPSFYHHTLTQKQMTVIQYMLSSRAYTITFGYGQCAIHYSLKSEKDYRTFLTLPLELRKCLTQLPLSEINKQKQYKSPHTIQIGGNINADKTIFVKDLSKNKVKSGLTIFDIDNEGHPINFSGCEKKLILPEEDEKRSPNK
jgi:hypothetical protein